MQSQWDGQKTTKEQFYRIGLRAFCNRRDAVLFYIYTVQAYIHLLHNFIHQIT